VALWIEILSPRVLDVAGNSLIDEGWSKSCTISTDGCNSSGPLSAAVLKIAEETLALLGLLGKDTLSLR